jgi:M6 family metalloprotease-like protein
MKEITNIVVVVVSIGAFSTLQAQVIDEAYCPMHTIEEPAETSAKLISCNPSTDICTGKYKPGKGTLKMLMVYIRFADDNTSMSYWNSTPNPSDIYDVETWMAKSLDKNSSIGSDNYFNVTNYFNQMSRGAYTVIGDVVYIELPSKSTFTDDGTPSGTQLKGLALMEATNKYALEYLDNNNQINLSDYDNFDYVSDYHHDQTSDNILDMVYMVYRTPGLQHFARKDTPGFEYGSFGGIAQLGKSGAQVALPSSLVVDYGAFANGSGLTMHLGDNKKQRFDDSYIHELAHYLMGNGHPYTNGSYYVDNVGRTGYWGIFGGGQATNSINAYEQELLGWITPIELTSTTTFTLSDFVTTGASYKYTVSPTEFYYFENRQKIQTTTGIDNTYDQPNWNDNDKGLFILHVKEPYLSSSINSLESVVSDGNWDWSLDISNSYQEDVCNDSGEPAFEKDVPNRFGESFKDPIMEVDNPNDSSGPYKQSLFVKASSPTQCKKYFLGYDTKDKSGFTETERSLITPYTNPAFLTRSKSQVGIGLKITGKYGNTLALKFYDDTFDPYDITEYTRWDGQIFLDQTTNVDNNATLTILPGTTVYLADNVQLIIRPGAKLMAEGTEQKPIKFVRMDSGQDWYSVNLMSSAGNSIKWALFDGGYNNLTVASKNNTLTHITSRNGWRGISGWHNQDGSGNASATISYALIEDNTSVGIVSHYMDLDLSYSTIRNNAQAGLYVSSNSVKPFHHNKITGNGGTPRWY